MPLQFIENSGSKKEAERCCSQPPPTRMRRLRQFSPAMRACVRLGVVVVLSAPSSLQTGNRHIGQENACQCVRCAPQVIPNPVRIRVRYCQAGYSTARVMRYRNIAWEVYSVASPSAEKRLQPRPVGTKSETLQTLTEHRSDRVRLAAVLRPLVLRCPLGIGFSHGLVFFCKHSPIRSNVAFGSSAVI